MIVNHPDVRLWALRWEVRTKIISLLFFIFGVVSLTSIEFVIYAFLFALGVALAMGLKMNVIGKSFLLLLPFFFLVSVPLLLGDGWPPSVERVEWYLLIVGKGLTSMMIIVMLVMTTTMHQLLTGLAHLKVPSVLLTVIFLSARYALHFLHELVFIRRAAVSRLIHKGKKIDQWKAYGQVSGRLLISSIDMSEQVHRAMMARGFTGHMPVSKPIKIKKSDLWLSALFFIWITGLVIGNGWWI